MAFLADQILILEETLVVECLIDDVSEDSLLAGGLNETGIEHAAGSW